ncbi:MAG: Nramp family divalent metal transporter [Pseudomonadales bacterium]
MKTNTLNQWGPGFMVAAAFIGPGTITTASRVGASTGLTLMWALLFSLVATYVLQEIALRLGLMTRQSLAGFLRSRLTGHFLKWPILGLVLVAIFFGNGAYQSGNLLGAMVGASQFIDRAPETLIIGIALIAGLLLASGWYRLVEGTLIFLVAVMALVFVTAAVIGMLQSDIALAEWIDWRWPASEDALVIALVGTTVVPYNLFLHASLVQEKWRDDVPLLVAIRQARRDLLLSVLVGGFVTLAVMIAARAAFYGSAAPPDLAGFAQVLAPVLGSAAGVCFALGLIAAGLTSAMTAPLAAAYVVTGALGWRSEMTGRGFKATWLLVLLTGAGVAVTGVAPMGAIVVAQYANGLMLPIIALILFWLSSRSEGMQALQVGVLRRGAAVGVILFCTVLTAEKLF